MKYLVRSLLMLCFLGTFFPGMVVADTPRPEVAKNVLAYEGTEGVKVWTLRIGPRSASEAIVQVGGVDHDWDMRIIRSRVEETAQGRRYVIQVDGKPFVFLNLKDGSGEVYLPGETKSRWVSYNEALSGQGNPEHFLTDYLQQK